MKKSCTIAGFLLFVQVCPAAPASGRQAAEWRLLRHAIYPVKVERSLSQDSPSDHALIKNRYIRFLIGTDRTFTGKLGSEARRQFLNRLKGPIRRAMGFDFSRDAGKAFSGLPRRSRPQGGGFRLLATLAAIPSVAGVRLLRECTRLECSPKTGPVLVRA